MGDDECHTDLHLPFTIYVVDNGNFRATYSSQCNYILFSFL